MLRTKIDLARMSFIVKRQFSTLIPPKIASPKSFSVNPNAKRMIEIGKFYKSLPSGNAPPEKAPTTPWGRYAAAYFVDDNASGKPLVHLAIAVIILGYVWEYNSHLKHHQ